MGYYDFPHTRNYDQDLGFLIKEFKKLYDEFQKLNSDEKIKAWFDDNKNYILSIFSKIIEETTTQIISKNIEQVFFGLTGDGYFMAIIPESWEEISFTTGNDYNDIKTYGHLILEY